jgi:hypothetical protein
MDPAAVAEHEPRRDRRDLPPQDNVRVGAAMFFFGGALFVAPCVAITAQMRRIEGPRHVLADLQIVSAAIGVLAIQIPAATFAETAGIVATSKGRVMEIRRIVTGHTPDGKATFIEDGSPPRTQDFKTIPGMRATLAWATDSGEAISGADPTAAATSFVPSPGSTRFIIVQFPPDGVYGSPDFDAPAAGAENMEIVPGLRKVRARRAWHAHDRFRGLRDRPRGRAGTRTRRRPGQVPEARRRRHPERDPPRLAQPDRLADDPRVRPRGRAALNRGHARDPVPE